MPHQYFPVLLAVGIAVLVGVGMVVVSQLLGRQTGGVAKLLPYESGVPLLDHSHKRLSVAFFLIAIDFIVFDLEAAFLYPYALVIRDFGWPLFGAILAFVFLILVGYAYVWRKGGLNIVVRGRRAVRG